MLVVNRKRRRGKRKHARWQSKGASPRPFPPRFACVGILVPRHAVIAQGEAGVRGRVVGHAAEALSGGTWSGHLLPKATKARRCTKKKRN